MQQFVAVIGVGFFVVLLQGCAAPTKPVGHETVAYSEENGMAP